MQTNQAKLALHFHWMVGEQAVAWLLLVFVMLPLAVKQSLMILKHWLALDMEGRLPPAELVTLVLYLLFFLAQTGRSFR